MPPIAQNIRRPAPHYPAGAPFQGEYQAGLLISP
jgi:hypothetical protein